MSNSFEEIATKAAGRFGAAKAAIKGLNGVFAQLEAEHKEVATLINRLSDSKDLEHRRALWIELSSALISHEQAEVHQVYKAFDGYPALQVIVDEHAHQVHRLEALVTELEALPMHVADWDLVFQRLEATVKQHVEEEETDFFLRAQDAIGKDKAKELEVPYLSYKRSLLRDL